MCLVIYIRPCGMLPDGSGQCPHFYKPTGGLPHCPVSTASDLIDFSVMLSQYATIRCFANASVNNGLVSCWFSGGGEAVNSLSDHNNSVQ